MGGLEFLWGEGFDESIGNDEGGFGFKAIDVVDDGFDECPAGGKSLQLVLLKFCGMDLCAEGEKGALNDGTEAYEERDEEVEFSGHGAAYIEID